MTRLPTAGLEVQERTFVALEGLWHALLGQLIDEFANVEGSGG
jgi:hypothetical protein